MNFFGRAKKEMVSLYIDASTEMATNRKQLKKPFAIGLGVGMMLALNVVACAETDIAGAGATLVTLGNSIYSAAFGVVSVFAAIMLVIAFIVRMTGNQQKAAQATTWITRIIICYVGVNCIGLIFKIIQTTTKGYGFT